MNIYLDNIIFYLQKSGGGSVYWSELVNRFINNDNVRFIDPVMETENIFYNKNIFNHLYENKYIPLKLLRYLPTTVNLEDNSVFHSSYYRISNNKSVKNVVTVHDFIYERYYKGFPKYIHHFQKSNAIEKSNGIICISNSTKKDLLHYFPNLVKNKSIEVIYNGVSNNFKKLSTPHQITSFHDLFKFKCILFVGHRSTYKNFYFAIDLINSLPENYKLVIVGKMLSEVEKKQLNKIIPNRYIFYGNVSNEELNIIYNFSFCLLYPSNYEGFGIPVIEAFKSGCPVVAQDIESIKEISRNNALLVNGLDKDKFLKNILSLNDTSLRQDKILNGFEISSFYSWDKCYSLVNQFYKSL